jgi:hypothetical protein
MLFSFTLTPLLAQITNVDSTTDSIPSKWALQFRMPSLLSVSQFLGGNISVLRAISDHSALRMGVDMSFVSSKDEQKRDHHITGIRINDRPTSLQEITLQVQYLIYSTEISGRRLYFGGGPFLSLSQVHYKWLEDDVIHRKVTNTDLTAGACGIIGVSMPVKSTLKIFAEYKTRFAYEFSEELEKFYNYEGAWFSTDTRTVKSWQTEPDGALLGLTLFFK